MLGCSPIKIEITRLEQLSRQGFYLKIGLKGHQITLSFKELILDNWLEVL